MHEHQVPVVLEFIVERVTNISMGNEISGVNEFEEILCLDPSLTLENGWVSMADQSAEPSLQSLAQGNASEN
jgi:tartronate-semialdehyde synthase